MSNTWRLGILALLVVVVACGKDGAAGAGETDASSSDGSDGSGAADSSEDDGVASVPGTCASYRSANITGLVFTSDGKPGGPMCSPAPEPCGGDPTGVWTLQASCGDETSIANPFASACPGAHFTPSPPAMQGLLTVDGAGHLELATTSTYDFEVVSDAFCFNGWNCGPELVPGLVDFFGGTASCTGDPDACTCNVMGAELDGQHLSGDGATDDDSVLDGLDASLVPRSLLYCVTDGVLQLWIAQQPTVTEVACNRDADCIAEEGRVAVCVAGG